MVRFPVLVVLLVLLATAWPALADGGSNSSDDQGFGPGEDDGVQTDDASNGNGTAEGTSDGASDGPSANSTSTEGADSQPMQQQDSQSSSSSPAVGLSFHMCKPYSLTMPGPNTPVTDVFRVDPDGCFTAYVRRTLGWSARFLLEVLP